jgi:hypothetical protein
MVEAACRRAGRMSETRTPYGEGQVFFHHEEIFGR